MSAGPTGRSRPTDILHSHPASFCGAYRNASFRNLSLPQYLRILQIICSGIMSHSGPWQRFLAQIPPTRPRLRNAPCTHVHKTHTPYADDLQNGLNAAKTRQAGGSFDKAALYISAGTSKNASAIEPVMHPIVSLSPPILIALQIQSSKSSPSKGHHQLPYPSAIT